MRKMVETKELEVWRELWSRLHKKSQLKYI